MREGMMAGMERGMREALGARQAKERNGGESREVEGVEGGGESRSRAGSRGSREK